MAQKRGQGASRNGRDSKSKRLGDKVGDNQLVTAGSILVRQVGSSKIAGKGVKEAKNHSLYAVLNGKVRFLKNKGRSMVSVVPVC